MTWIIEVLLLDKEGHPGVGANEKWTAVGPAAMPRYEFPEEEQARVTLRMCYPDQLIAQRLDGVPRVRVRQVSA